MFGKEKQPPIRSLIGDGSVIRGELRFTDGLRIDGEIIGDVIAEGDGTNILVISEQSRITGKVSAGHVIINGYVKGPIHSFQLLELQPKAKIEGNVHYHVLEMHQGAVIDGEMHPLSADEKAPLKLASSLT